MDVVAVLDEITEALEGVTGIRVIGYPPATLTPPAGVVSYPERITYNLTTGPTGARIEGLPVVLVAGRATEKSSRDSAARWASTEGESSVKAALEAAAHTAFDVLTVTNCSFDVVTIGSIDYIAAMFTIDVVGY